MLTLEEINKIGKELYRTLEELLKQIPKRKVTTYKILAETLGSRFATKFVYFALKENKFENWWKVVNEKGEIKDEEQRKKILEEGIEIKNNKIINLEKYLFKDFNIEEKPLKKLREIQRKLTEKIVLKDEFDKVEIIGGVDLSYKGNKGKVTFVLLDKDLKLIKYYVFEEEIDFPYIPTFLAFREGIPIVKNFDKIDPKPDILFVNGFGIAHPVKMGLATFVGVLLDIPTIGITKSLLTGKIINDKIILNNETVGYVLRKFGYTVYVSPGNKISLETSRELAEKTWVKGKYPEPIRLADELSKRAKSSSLLKFL